MCDNVSNPDIWEQIFAETQKMVAAKEKTTDQVSAQPVAEQPVPAASQITALKKISACNGNPNVPQGTFVWIWEEKSCNVYWGQFMGIDSSLPLFRVIDESGVMHFVDDIYFDHDLVKSECRERIHYHLRELNRRQMELSEETAQVNDGIDSYTQRLKELG
ncbi:MAG: hypothetical protein WC471_03260 [Candidatus Woesearchaeota archaeon]